jgi:hypothetical protein
MRRETRRFLLHTYTREARLGADSMNEWGQQTYNFATPVAGIPCFYAVSEVPVVTPQGLIRFNLPTMTLAFDDPVEVGDRVTNIITADGTVLVIGPVVIESLQPQDPNVGGPVLIQAKLREVNYVATTITPVP